jgi:hypothetical protein
MASPLSFSRPSWKLAMLTPCLPKRRAENADDAGRVVVGRVDHVLADLGVDVDALDLDEARLAVGEHRAGDRAGCVRWSPSA